MLRFSLCDDAAATGVREEEEEEEAPCLSVPVWGQRLLGARKRWGQGSVAEYEGYRARKDAWERVLGGDVDGGTRGGVLLGG